MNDYALAFLSSVHVTNRLGIIAMDYPGAALINVIIAENFRKSLVAGSKNSVVTTTSDSDPGSLRWIIEAAGSAPGYARDFEYLFNNLAYNGTDIGGSQQALDRAIMLQTFLDFVLPNEFMNTAVWIDDPIVLGLSASQNGRYAITDWIDTDNIFATREYMAVGFNTRSSSYVYHNASLKTFVDGTINTDPGFRFSSRCSNSLPALRARSGFTPYQISDDRRILTEAQAD